MCVRACICLDMSEYVLSVSQCSKTVCALLFPARHSKINLIVCTLSISLAPNKKAHNNRVTLHICVYTHLLDSWEYFNINNNTHMICCETRSIFMHADHHAFDMAIDDMKQTAEIQLLILLLLLWLIFMVTGIG